MWSAQANQAQLSLSLSPLLFLLPDGLQLLLPDALLPEPLHLVPLVLLDQVLLLLVELVAVRSVLYGDVADQFLSTPHNTKEYKWR